MSSSCRMYEGRLPEIDEVVMVEIKSIADSAMGVYVSLLEYDNIGGLILTAELSRRRIRSINQLVRVGRIEPAMVLRVDKDKGYIDLSKRRVDAEDAARCAVRYNKSKAVHSIVRNVAQALGRDLEQTYRATAWPLYATHGHAFDAFQRAAVQPAVLGALNLDPELDDALMKDVRRRMTPQPLKLRADVELTCFAYDGVLHIKDAMRAALAAAPLVSFKLIAAPLYILTAQTLNADEGLAALAAAVRAAAATVEAAGGALAVKVAPRVLSEHEDMAMQQKIEEAANPVHEEDEEEEEENGMGNLDVEATAF